MTPQEMKDNFEKNIEYLKSVVPPDDIYIFTEQTFMATLYFLKRWSEHVNLIDEMQKDNVADKWVRNILGYLDSRDKKRKIIIDLNLDSLDEEE